ncbi:hypothetical protein [Aureispira sp. CCB-QB1]|uniref:hypothetical protein n=1 Tax=Aureispira sp. CCB-QB1 TaxID=1313421 RepID=UPI000697CCE7|nr:hypothetical protein [Aureispira sp. CCB-QB1]
MIRISLTDFMNFVTNLGSKRQKKVTELIQRGSYESYKDFYKKLREAIIGMHRNSKTPKTLNNILPSLTDAKKIGVYPNLIAAYIRFIGRKKMDWIDPPRATWEYKQLRVKINPELGLRFRAKKSAPVKDYIIKLHLKKEKLEKDKAALFLFLMENELRHQSSNEVEYCVLDVSRKKLFLSSNFKKDCMPVLKGDAESLISIWNDLTQTI